MTDPNRPPLSPAEPEPVGDAHLSAEDQMLLAEILIHPPSPNDALRRAKHLHEDCVVSPATAQAHSEPEVAVPDSLLELRGMFERILCVARSSGEKPVGNIELADRLIKAVASWGALPLPAGGGAAMTTPNRQALWEVMRDAYDVSPPVPVDADLDWIDRHGYAAEIRAAAEWIKKARPDYDEVLHGAIRADELDSILALLAAEADRAERGDG